MRSTKIHKHPFTLNVPHFLYFLPSWLEGWHSSDSNNNSRNELNHPKGPHNSFNSIFYWENEKLIFFFFCWWDELVSDILALFFYFPWLFFEMHDWKTENCQGFVSVCTFSCLKLGQTLSSRLDLRLLGWWWHLAIHIVWIVTVTWQHRSWDDMLFT